MEEYRKLSLNKANELVTLLSLFACIAIASLFFKVDTFTVSFYLSLIMLHSSILFGVLFKMRQIGELAKARSFSIYSHPYRMFSLIQIGLFLFGIILGEYVLLGS